MLTRRVAYCSRQQRKDVLYGPRRQCTKALILLLRHTMDHGSRNGSHHTCRESSLYHRTS